MRESKADRDIRLNSSGPAGKALLSALEEFGSSVALANKADTDPGVVASWISRGKISMRGATNLAAATGRDRAEFRPDLTDEDWARDFPGRIPGQGAASDTADAKLLIDTARKIGTVASFCEAAGITVSNFHTWKARGKIPVARRAIVEELAAR